MGQKVSIDPRCYLLWAAMILLLPANWTAGAFLAAAFHEACHMSALFLCRAEIRHLAIRPGGAEIEVGPMDPVTELICAGSGPAGSLLLVFFQNQFPELALCGLIQGLFNLLPIYPLDGGRILFCLLQWMIPKKAETITNGVGFVISISGIAFWLVYGFLPGALVFGKLAMDVISKNFLQRGESRCTI